MTFLADDRSRQCLDIGIDRLFMGFIAPVLVRGVRALGAVAVAATAEGLFAITLCKCEIRREDMDSKRCGPSSGIGDIRRRRASDGHVWVCRARRHGESLSRSVRGRSPVSS